MTEVSNIKKIARQSIGRITHDVAIMLNKMANLTEYDSNITYPPFHHLHNAIHENIGILFNADDDYLFDECSVDSNKILDEFETNIRCYLHLTVFRIQEYCTVPCLFL